jgi:hypothetical protein
VNLGAGAAGLQPATDGNSAAVKAGPTPGVAPLHPDPQFPAEIKARPDLLIPYVLTTSNSLLD